MTKEGGYVEKSSGSAKYSDILTMWLAGYLDDCSHLFLPWMANVINNCLSIPPEGCESCNYCSKLILHAVSLSNFQDNLAPKGVYRNSVKQNAKKKMSIFTWDW